MKEICLISLFVLCCTKSVEVCKWHPTCAKPGCDGRAYESFGCGYESKHCDQKNGKTCCTISGSRSLKGTHSRCRDVFVLSKGIKNNPILYS